MDTETQLPPHLLAPQLLCDYLGTPYPEPLQSAYRWSRLTGGTVPLPGPPPRGPASIPDGLSMVPPTIQVWGDDISVDLAPFPSKCGHGLEPSLQG